MMTLRLLAVNDLSSVDMDMRVPIDELPERVVLVNCGYDGGVLLPEGYAALLLTDDPAHAQRYAGEERVFTVFVGEHSKCAEFSDRLFDLWSASDGAELIYKRYIRAIASVKTLFDADFYSRALDTTVNTVPDMMWFRRRDGIHTLVNGEFCRVVRKDRLDIVGKDSRRIWEVSAEDAEDGSSDEEAIASGETFVCDEPLMTGEGVKQFTTYRSPLKDMFGNIFGTVCLGHDVTNFSNMGIELTILVENLPYPMTIFSADWKVVRMNGYFSELAGVYSKAQEESFDYAAWKSEMLIPAGERMENKTKHTSSREYYIVHKGDKRCFEVTELEIRDYFDNVSGYFVTLLDVTYQRAYEDSILEAANTDMLTGLYNRRFFYNHLSQLKGKPFTLLYMDLDRFKAINDTLGHASGDTALIKTAELIKEHFPESVCARLGGDEFAVIDEGHGLAFLTEQSKMLEKAVAEAFASLGTGTTISIGINRSDGTAEDIDQLFGESDAKMYAIKKQHHDRFMNT
ncbi:MAG: sensor domain-containing diguanylate cyclase [Ruminococcus sp.]|nr:sensor domain-containing diguanylate cyclase [Ruminococcus sp.]